MLEPERVAEILKTCESIGFTDEELYITRPSWDVCVKDLILYLRRDDDDHSIRRLLGQAQVVGRDLLPLLKHHSKDEKVWSVALRLLVNLTHPALLLYDEEVPKNKKYLNYYHLLEGYLRTYKEAFVDKMVWKTLTEKLKQLLDLEWEKTMEQDKLTIERILILVRNILHVPADPSEEKRADDDTTLHDRILMVMHISGFEDLILYTASSLATQEYSLLVLEIMSWMLREQTGEQLAKTQLARNEDDSIQEEKELILIREKEAVLKNIQMQKLPSRHSRFGGTFVVRDMKAPSGNDLLCHKPITSVADLSLDSKKKRKKVASNRKAITGEDSTRRSTLPVRMILKNFCVAFLSDTYNRMMSTVKDSIVRGRMEDNDETYYLWSMKFFMEFNRHHEFRVTYVNDTLSTNTFHHVQTLLDRYQGMMVTDKEKIPFWSRRAHMALKAYQELLFTLVWMDKDGDESVHESSRAIKNNVFYLPEYRELCLALLNTYDPIKLSKLYLKDLIETNHLFLKMLQDYSSRGRRIMIKSKRKKRKAVKNLKKSKKARKAVSVPTMSSSELDEAWTKASEEISSTLISTELPDPAAGEEVTSLNPDVIPFDAASDVPIDEQKTTAVERIAVFLHTSKLKEAVMLLRASREVWPTNPEYFGDVNCEPSDEEEILKSIYMENASLPAVTQARILLQNGPDGSDVESGAGPIGEDDYERAAVIGEDEEDEEEDEEDEEEVEQEIDGREEEFDFRGFLLKYATAKVVCNYSLLLQDWDKLKPLTLHCILKMFHRFVFDMNYPALICQASLFLTFKKILEVADRRSDLRDVKTFFSHFWPKFVKLCNNKKMFVEILFWKTAREAQEIQDDYADLRGTGQSAPSKKKSKWSSDEEEQLDLLIELYQDATEEVKRAQKLIEFVMERWTYKPRSKRIFMQKLVEKEALDPSAIAKKFRPPKTWGDNEIEKLRELFEEHKESDNIIGNILEHLEIKRSKNSVIDKMIQLDLIKDKSEVKKTRRRSKKSRSQISRVDSDSDNEGEGERTRRESTGAQSGSELDSGSSHSSHSESDGNESEDGINNTYERPTGTYDDEKVCDVGKKLVKSDMTGAVRWVKQSLNYFLEDIIDDPDTDENVPLVPIESGCISAIATADFKQFLKALGFYPPAEQETYWRIPSTLKKKDVELRLETLERVLTYEDSASISTETGTQKKKKSRLVVDSDSDDDISSPNPNFNNITSHGSDVGSTPKKPESVDGTRGILSDLDSDDDISALRATPDNEMLEELNDVDLESDKIVLSDHESSMDDDDDDKGVGTVVKKKRALVIDSDSD